METAWWNTIVESGLDGQDPWVALFLDNSEVSSGNYSRKQITDWDNVSAGSKQAAAAVTFTASGSNIQYDEIRLYSASSGGTLYDTRAETGGDQIINDGDTHNITIIYNEA